MAVCHYRYLIAISSRNIAGKKLLDGYLLSIKKVHAKIGDSESARLTNNSSNNESTIQVCIVWKDYRRSFYISLVAANTTFRTQLVRRKTAGTQLVIINVGIDHEVGLKVSSAPAFLVEG